MLSNLPDAVSQLAAIFLSIIIEALPFVLFGCLVSGFIETYLSPEIVYKFLPKQRFLRVIVGIIAGFFFPSCECGIVPIVNRFLEKKVPSYTGIPFLIAAPIINPVVLFATFVAFGNSFKFAFLRLSGALIIALVVGLVLAYLLGDEPILLATQSHDAHDHHDHTHSLNRGQKFWSALSHAVDEFFDTGRYLIFGSLIASTIQVFVPTKWLTSVTHNPFTAILLMMLFALLLSLCSEADAFIGASLLNLFGTAPIIAFLLFGPIIDIKNLLMMKRYFRSRFIVKYVLGVSFLVIMIGMGVSFL
ncbi:permease [Lactococcus insecticola]|uniref:Putative two-component membrane permease complex subunit n=1 Tax=Pseudolactococcus insecticola TaxID=2709158 RepID=A0A6A0B9C3_9LACT|nr:permease [Lactococcus insecticola]GFH40924.1 putative two-component membrane permease complex subunit [Lactococcus insecticola]